MTSLPFFSSFLSPLEGAYGVSTYGQNLQHTDGASCPTRSAMQIQDPRFSTIPTGFEDFVAAVTQREEPSGAQDNRLGGVGGTRNRSIVRRRSTTQYHVIENQEIIILK